MIVRNKIETKTKALFFLASDPKTCRTSSPSVSSQVAVNRRLFNFPFVKSWLQLSPKICRKWGGLSSKPTPPPFLQLSLTQVLLNEKKKLFKFNLLQLLSWVDVKKSGPNFFAFSDKKKEFCFQRIFFDPKPSKFSRIEMSAKFFSPFFVKDGKKISAKKPQILFFLTIFFHLSRK